MGRSRIVVVGSGYAGVMAALRAKARGGASVEVTLISLGGG
jgi:NADH dehydrogenase FAD-containing subunit